MHTTTSRRTGQAAPSAIPRQTRAADVDVFRLRCAAAGAQVAAGLMDFHQAVDGLQTAAEAYGLVSKIGQDAIQHLMADAFRRVR
jgi:hypothetical protein